MIMPCIFGAGNAYSWQLYL